MRKLIYIEALELNSLQTLFKIIGFDESQRKIHETHPLVQVKCYDHFDIDYIGQTLYLPGRLRDRDELPVVYPNNAGNTVDIAKGLVRRWEELGGFEGAMVYNPPFLTEFQSISSMDHRVVHLSNLSFEYLGGKGNFCILRIIQLRKYAADRTSIFRKTYDDEYTGKTSITFQLQGDRPYRTGSSSHTVRGFEDNSIKVNDILLALYCNSPLNPLGMPLPFTDIRLTKKHPYDPDIDLFSWVLDKMIGLDKAIGWYLAQNGEGDSPMQKLSDPIDPTSGEIF